jgi:hypothetical protein
MNVWLQRMLNSVPAGFAGRLFLPTSAHRGHIAGAKRVDLFQLQRSTARFLLPRAVIARQLTNQAAESANVLEQLLVDAPLRSLLRLLERSLRAGSVSGPEAGDGELAQKRRLRTGANCLFQVLHGFTKAAPFQGDRSQGSEGVVSQLPGSDLERFSGEVASGIEVVSQLGLDQCELVGGHTARQGVGGFVVKPEGQATSSSGPFGVAQRLEEGDHGSGEVGGPLRAFAKDGVGVTHGGSSLAEGGGQEGGCRLQLRLSRGSLESGGEVL